MSDRTAVGLGLNALVIAILLLATAVRVLTAPRETTTTCLSKDDKTGTCRTKN